MLHLVAWCHSMLPGVGKPDMIGSGGARMDETFLTPEQAAEMLNLSAYTIREYARKGVMPAHKIGRTWRFSRADLEAWVLANGQGPAPEDVPVARDSPCPLTPRTLPDTAIERSLAVQTLLEIRARARKGSVSRILQESRRELLARGRLDRDGK